MTPEEADATLVTMTDEDFPTVDPEGDVDDALVDRLVVAAHELMARRGRDHPKPSTIRHHPHATR